MSKFDFNKIKENLQSNVKSMGSGEKYKEDTRFWKLSKDENGKGAAIIRLLPDPNLVPFAKIFSYTLNKAHPTIPGKKLWFIQNSPDSIGLPCPVKELYTRLMSEGTEESKAEAKKYNRSANFIANILVVKDPANPENNGKVFLWKFGTKLLEKFDAWVNPSDSELEMGSVPMDVWNPVEGHNITLKIKKNAFSFDYDDTTIVPTITPANASIIDDDSGEAFIGKHCYDVSEFLKPEFYNSYDSIKTSLAAYTGLELPSSNTSNTVTKKATPVVEEELPEFMETPKKTAVAKKVEDDDLDTSWMEDL